MSCHVNLTRDIIDYVRSLLKIKSTTNKHRSEKIVNFYRVRGTTYIVPFFFGRKLLHSRLDNEKKKDSEIVQNNRHISFIGKLRTKQVSVVQDSIKLLNDTKTVLLALKPGFGKTVISVYLVSRYLSSGHKTLVLIKASILQSQWMDSFSNFSTAKVICVPASSCSKKVKCEFDKAIESTDVIICMYMRINNIPSNVISSIDILIVDE